MVTRPSTSSEGTVTSGASTCSFNEGSRRFCLFESTKSTKEVVESLKGKERECYTYLKLKWQTNNDKRLPPSAILRLALCSPGEPFDVDKAMSVLRIFNDRYLALTWKCLLSKNPAVIPIPGLVTKQGHSVVYMRANLFAGMKTQQVLDNLVYVMDFVNASEEVCKKGIAIVFNLKDSKIQDYPSDLLSSLVAIWQSKGCATRISRIYLVDAPSWFKPLWMVHSKGLSRQLRDNVASLSQVEARMALGPQTYLPDELGGLVNTIQLAKDFLHYMKIVEKAFKKTPSSSSDGGSVVSKETSNYFM